MSKAKTMIRNASSTVTRTTIRRAAAVVALITYLLSGAHSVATGGPFVAAILDLPTVAVVGAFAAAYGLGAVLVFVLSAVLFVR